MVFSPLTPETLPGRGLAVVALHLPLQHIREQGRAVERGVQWGGVMRLCWCCTTVMVPLLRFHRFPDSVRIRLVQGRSMSSALTKAMKRCFGPAAFLQRFGSGDMQWGGVMGLCYCCTIVMVPPLRLYRFPDSVWTR